MQGIEIVYPVGASIIWSANPAFIYRFARDVSPYYFTAIRAFLAFIFLATLVFTIGSLHFESLTTSILVLMVLSAVLGPGLGDITYTRAIQLIGGPLAITIGYAYIFFAQLFAVLFFNEKITFMTITGSIVAFAGIYIAVSKSNDSRPVTKKGIMYSLSSAILWGLGTSTISPVREYVDAYTTALIRVLSVTIFALIIGLIRQDKFRINKGIFIAALFTGVVGWGLGMLLFIHSIFVMGVSVTTTITSLAPVLAQFINKIVTGEPLSSRVLAGAILVCLGIIFTIL